MLKRSGKEHQFDSQTINSYSQWQELAHDYDRKHGLEAWKLTDKTKLYDYKSIKSRLKGLRTLHKAGDAGGLLYALNEGIHGNMGGMGRSNLYQKAKSGTKQLITDYVDEVVFALEFIAEADEVEIPDIEKLEFFRRASHCFGKTALMLSGSGNLFYFHLGVVKALWEQDLLPQVISGASGGAIVAAIIGTHTADELEKVFDPEYMKLEIESRLNGAENSKRIKRFRRISRPTVEQFLSRLIPDITFQEAAEMTGININVSVAPASKHQSSRLLNAIASPDVMIHEALLASSAMPGFYPAVTLAAKDRDGKRKPYQPQYQWIDGSVSDDLPIKKVMRLYGVNHTIVSQTNPLVLPFINDQDTSEAMSHFREIVEFTTKKWVLWSTKLIDKRLRYDSSLGKSLNYMRAVVSQSYTGDINILPPTRIHNPVNLLSNRTSEEILELIKFGERATWSKIEAIRIQTKVSRRLDEIINDLDTRMTNKKTSTKHSRK